MGGKEASRGYLYQAYVSVLEALCEEGWDKIYIEFSSEDNKVDIALEKSNTIFKVIQVKSTINSFSQISVSRWLKDLIDDDVGANIFEVFLIGNCDRDAMSFINAVEKFCSGKMDKTAKNTLKDFDTSILENKVIKILTYPCQIEILGKLIRESLLKYVSKNNEVLSYEQLCFITSAMVNDQMISSTNGEGISKTVFDADLKQRILLLAKESIEKRKTLGIKSFTRSTQNMEEQATEIVSMTDMFDGRNKKQEFDWKNDIYISVEDFLVSNTNTDKKYALYLDTHSSIAFSSGRVLDTKTGINIFPMQKSALGGLELWDINYDIQGKYTDYNIKHEKVDESYLDTVLIVNATRNIYKDVKEYLKLENFQIGHIINCSPKNDLATNTFIENGTHASVFANAISNAVAQRTALERRAILHIFTAAPNAFMFFLGRLSRGFGKCVLYEYDFEQTDTCTYYQTIEF